MISQQLVRYGTLLLSILVTPCVLIVFVDVVESITAVCSLLRSYSSMDHYDSLLTSFVDRGIRLVENIAKPLITTSMHVFLFHSVS